MSKLWVKLPKFNATQVSTAECQNVDDFLRSCKKELLSTLSSYDVCQLSLSITAKGPPLQPGDAIPEHNTAETPVDKKSDKITAFNKLATKHTVMQDHCKRQLPCLPNGKRYIVIPHAEFIPETIAILKSIGSKANLLWNHEDLEILDEDFVLSRA